MQDHLSISLALSLKADSFLKADSKLVVVDQSGKASQVPASGNEKP